MFSDPHPLYFATHTETDECMTVFHGGGDCSAIQIVETAYYSNATHSLDALGDAFPAPVVEPGMYRHYKGGFYEVMFGFVQHALTGDLFTVYRGTQDCRLWARPSFMFIEDIGCEPRFKRFRDAFALDAPKLRL